MINEEVTSHLLPVNDFNIYHLTFNIHYLHCIHSLNESHLFLRQLLKHLLPVFVLRI